MPVETPTNTPKKKEILEDNARKFIVESLNPQLLADNNATSFVLSVDWLEINEDNEKKLAYKTFENGDIQILLIAKVTDEGNRTAKKEPLSEEQYKALLGDSLLHLEKKRYELNYSQNGTLFSVKYDELAGDKPPMLEVDAASAEERNSFNPDEFPAELTEVTGDLRYYGYRVANL